MSSPFKDDLKLPEISFDFPVRRPVSHPYTGIRYTLARELAAAQADETPPLAPMEPRTYTSLFPDPALLTGSSFDFYARHRRGQSLEATAAARTLADMATAARAALPQPQAQPHAAGGSETPCNECNFSHRMHPYAAPGPRPRPSSPVAGPSGGFNAANAYQGSSSGSSPTGIPSPNDWFQDSVAYVPEAPNQPAAAQESTSPTSFSSDSQQGRPQELQQADLDMRVEQAAPNMGTYLAFHHNIDHCQVTPPTLSVPSEHFTHSLAELHDANCCQQSTGLSKPESQVPWFCTECSLFVCWNRLDSHHSIHKNDNERQPESVRYTRPGTEDTHGCKVCDRFVSKRFVADHLKVHTMTADNSEQVLGDRRCQHCRKNPSHKCEVFIDPAKNNTYRCKLCITSKISCEFHSQYKGGKHTTHPALLHD